MHAETRKTVLITGAARGIGTAIAERFIADGCDVILNYRRTQGKGARNIVRLTELAASKHLRAIPALADISEPREIENMVAQLTGQGIERIDHLILNAASTPLKYFREMTPRDWKTLLGTNLIGNVNCVTRITPLMPPGSTICALSSTGSRKVMPKYPLGVIKSAVENLVRYLEVELYPQNIRVNGICAGLVKTDMLPILARLWTGSLDDAAQPKLPRPLVEPEQIADVVAFLASEQSAAIRGQILIADLGMQL